DVCSSDLRKLALQTRARTGRRRAKLDQETAVQLAPSSVGVALLDHDFLKRGREIVHGELQLPRAAHRPGGADVRGAKRRRAQPGAPGLQASGVGVEDR